MAEVEKSVLNKSELYAEHIQKWQQSGLIQEQYCKLVNISHPVFVYWQTKFLSQDKKNLIDSQQRFVSVKPVLAATHSQTPIFTSEPQYITVTIPNGVQFSFPLSINPTVIGEYIKMLRESL